MHAPVLLHFFGLEISSFEGSFQIVITTPKVSEFSLNLHILQLNNSYAWLRIRFCIFPFVWAYRGLAAHQSSLKCKPVAAVEISIHSNVSLVLMAL